MEFDLIKNAKNFSLFKSLVLSIVCGKKTLRNYTEIINNLIIQDHNLSSVVLYEILIDANKIKLNSQTYFGNCFSKSDWKFIYFLDV